MPFEFRCPAFAIRGLPALIIVFATLWGFASGANAAAEAGDEETLQNTVHLVVQATQEYQRAFDKQGKLVREKERRAAEDGLERVKKDAPSPEIDELLSLMRRGRPVAEVAAARDRWYEKHALGATPARPVRALSRSNGKALYLRYCTVCHGADGGGDGPGARMIEGAAPTNFLDQEYMRRAKPETFFQAITLGVPGSSMTEWGDVLETQSRWDLVAYLWSLRPAAGAAPSPQSCMACHSSRGPADDLTRPGALAGISDEGLVDRAADAEAHKGETKTRLKALAEVARTLDLAADGASLAKFERLQIPRMLDLLVEQYRYAVENGEIVDALEYFEARSYQRQIATDIERVVGTGGIDSSTVRELSEKLADAVDGKAPSADVADLAVRLKAAVALNLAK